MTDPNPPSRRRTRAGKLVADLFARHGVTPPPAATAEPEPTGLDRAAVAAWNRQRAHERHLRLVPARYATATADHPQVQDWATAWTRDQHACPWLLMLGDVGTGKTHAAYGALRWIADSGHPPVDWRAVTATDFIACQLPGGAPNTESAYADLADAPILLLDDLGTTRRSAFNEQIIFRLIDYRYSQNLTTIITSNLPGEHFRDEVGARTNSRLREMCMLIDFGRTDRRRPPGTAA